MTNRLRYASPDLDIYQDFSQLPSGFVVPASYDDGFTISTGQRAKSLTTGARQQVINPGAPTAGSLVSTDLGVQYFAVESSKQILEIMTRFSLPGVGANANSLALPTWGGPQTLSPRIIPAGPFHIVMSDLQETFAMWMSLTGQTGTGNQKFYSSHPIAHDPSLFYDIFCGLDINNGYANIVWGDGYSESIRIQTPDWYNGWAPSGGATTPLGIPCYANGNTYILVAVTGDGTTSSTGNGPSGTGTNIADNNCSWSYWGTGRIDPLKMYPGFEPTWEHYNSPAGQGTSGRFHVIGASTTARSSVGPRHFPIRKALQASVPVNRTYQQSYATKAWTANQQVYGPNDAPLGKLADTRVVNGVLLRYLSAGITGSTAPSSTAAGTDGTAPYELVTPMTADQWTASTTYRAGCIVWSGTNWVRANGDGTSGTTAPTGVGTAISDGSMTWSSRLDITGGTNMGGVAVKIGTTPTKVDSLQIVVPPEKRVRVATSQYVLLNYTLLNWTASATRTLGDIVAVGPRIYYYNNASPAAANSTGTGPTSTAAGNIADGSATCVFLGYGAHAGQDFWISMNIAGQSQYSTGNKRVRTKMGTSQQIDFEGYIDLSGFPVGAKFELQVLMFTNRAGINGNGSAWKIGDTDNAIGCRTSFTPAKAA